MNADERRLPTDPWAEWLLRGRQQGMSARETQRMQRQLARLRDRVLTRARLRVGMRVLDVGAGTGLLALDARRRVGPSGRVYALDISRDALLAARQSAAATADAAPLALLVGEATRLPFADASLDRMLTRSVLIYVEEKAAAAREVFRVLRPGGRASLFETINNIGSARRRREAKERAAGGAAPDTDGRAGEHDWLGVKEYGPLQAERDRVRAYQEAHWPHRAAMLDFTEHDLVGVFVDAGFDVELSFLQWEGVTPAASPRARERRRTAAHGMLARRPNPTLPSYAEAAFAVLGDDAPRHLEQLIELLLDRPRTSASAAAYLVARKPRR